MDEFEYYRIELGFRFERPFWGRGFATEVGAAWISTAFGDLGLDELGAFVHPENTVSLRGLPIKEIPREAELEFNGDTDTVRITVSGGRVQEVDYACHTG